MAGSPDPEAVLRERDRTIRHIWVAVIERRMEIDEETRKDLANRTANALGKMMG